jgi:hypothetical protein
MDTLLGIIPMIETAPSANGEEAKNDQFNTEACDDVPCDCDCDCYDCVNYSS